MPRMKLAGALLLSGLLAAPLYPADFMIKLTGGMGTFGSEGLKRGLSGWVEWQRREADSRNLWTLLSEDVGELSGMFEFEGELIFRFHSRLAVSAGVGILFADQSEERAQLVMQKATGDFNLIHPQKISAIPLLVSGYYFLPVNRIIQLYARVGGGLVLARHIDKEGSKKIDAEKYGYSIEQNVSASGPMFIGMLGVKADTPSGLSFILEAGYRHARISGLTGETDEGETWTMYAFEQYHADLEYWRYRNSLYRELPSGADVRGAEETSIDLSGLTVRLGIMVRF